VDTHVFRVARRLGLISHKATPDQAHAMLEGQVQPEEVYTLHMGLILHGRRVCHAQRPACDRCIFADRCPSRVLFEAGEGNRKKGWRRVPAQDSRKQP
jgi:endonuclease-3